MTTVDLVTRVATTTGSRDGANSRGWRVDTATGDDIVERHRRLQRAVGVVAVLALFWGGLWSIHAVVDGWWLRGLLGVVWVMVLGSVVRRSRSIRARGH